MLFTKLTGGPFFQGRFLNLQIFGFLQRTSFSKLRVWVFVEQVKTVLLPEMGRMTPKVWQAQCTQQ